MTLCYEMPNARAGFVPLLKQVMAGKPNRVDGHMTYEQLGAQITLLDPLDSLPTDLGVKLDLGAYVDTLLDVLGGVGKLSVRSLRLRHQLTDAERLFSIDPWSLGALCMTIDPMYDRMVPEPSMTEMIACHFIYREQAMHLQTYYRSMDVLHELPHEMFLWSQVLATMQNVTAAPKLGAVAFHVGSLRIHSSDTSITDYIKERPIPSERPIGLPSGLRGASWDEIVERARWLASLFSGDRPAASNLTASERWYLDQRLPLSVSR